MNTWTHLMVGTIVFGPRPEMVLGTLAVDTFDYLNWITRLVSGNLPLKLVKTNPEKFNKIVDSGPIWQIHHFLNYTLWSLIGGVILARYFYLRGNNY